MQMCLNTSRVLTYTLYIHKLTFACEFVSPYSWCSVCPPNMNTISVPYESLKLHQYKCIRFGYHGIFKNSAGLIERTIRCPFTNVRLLIFSWEKIDLLLYVLHFQTISATSAGWRRRHQPHHPMMVSFYKHTHSQQKVVILL